MCAVLYNIMYQNMDGGQIYILSFDQRRKHLIQSYHMWKYLKLHSPSYYINVLSDTIYKHNNKYIININ